MNTTQLLKELREIMEGELDSNDFSFGIGCYEGEWKNQYGEYILSDNIQASVTFDAEGWRHIDRGDYYTPPCESGEITIYIKSVDFWSEDGENHVEYKSDTLPNKQNTIKITF